MSEILRLAPAWLSGCALGFLFFGGLWLTISKGLTSNHPALWFLASLILRMGVVIGGFYFVSGGDWERLLTCLLGFLIARLVVSWITRPQERVEVGATREASHSP